MIARNVEVRIIKLEALRRRPDETLVVWRKPDGDKSAAVADVKVAHGDRVICMEWFGAGAVPAPKWHRNLRHDLDEEEKRSMYRSTKRVIEARPDQLAAKPAAEPTPNLSHVSDADLMLVMFGVET